MSVVLLKANLRIDSACILPFCCQAGKTLETTQAGPDFVSFSSARLIGNIGVGHLSTGNKNNVCFAGRNNLFQ